MKGSSTCWTLVAALAVAVSALTACSSPTAPGAAGGDGGQADRRVAALTIAVARDAGTLIPFNNEAEPGILELVYDKLLSPSPYVATPQPWLAEQVQQLDPSTWEVKLRHGVRWHDGAPFTADDVKFTFEVFKKSPTSRYTHHVSEVPNISAIEAPDVSTVRFTCAYACPDLGSITLADLPIIPKHIWQGVAEPTKFGDLPVGTGPYRLVDYDRSRGYRFQANADYFAGRPLVDEIVAPIIEDEAATFTALRTGEIHAATRSVPPELVQQFKGDSAIRLAAIKPLEWPEVRLNFRRAPFDNPEVRRAVSRGLDRAELLASLKLGQGRPSTKGYPHPDTPWADPSLSTPTDTGEARRLLDGAGLTDRDGDGSREAPDGRPLTMTIKATGSEPLQVRAAQLVAEQLGKLGLNVNLQTVDAGAAAALSRTYDFDLLIGQVTAHAVADPTQFIMSHRSGYLWQSPLVPYPEWDALFDQWKATTTVADRKSVLFRMEQLFNRQPTAIALYYPDEFRAFRPATFTGWVEAIGFGIVNKWSFLPQEVGRRAAAITQAYGS